MPKIVNIISLFILILLQSTVYSKQDSLYNQIQEIAKQAKGKVSVAAQVPEDSISFSFYGDEMCVMQSVFKFPIALAILNKIDKQEFSLLHKIHITPKEMIKDTWSPMRDSFPDGNVNITFENLLKYMVSQSDNIACDVLLHHLGKPKVVQNYIRKMGIDDFAMKYNEAGMHKKWKNQYSNVCSPNAMVAMLEKFYDGKVLSPANTAFLNKIMTETTTGKNRIKKYLPSNAVVAHKTGSSGTNEAGMTAAVNDVGIITLPNGKHLVLAIFVNDAYADFAVLEETIAAISKALFDAYYHP
ncbi:MAG: class A beta-lactamase, subclass A2 [Chitinophagales bacterium]